MNKEQAEIYVVKSLNTSKIISRKFQYNFLLLNVVLFGVAIALFREITFVVFISIIAGLNMIFTILLARKKPNIFKITILVIVQLAVFCVALNCIIFALYNFVNAFVLWEFLVSINISLIAFIFGFLFVKNRAEKFKPQEGFPKIEVIAGSMGGTTCTLTLVLCRIFSPSLLTVITPIALLINILVCLTMGFGVSAALYRAFLIRKYDLKFTDN